MSKYVHAAMRSYEKRHAAEAQELIAQHGKDSEVIKQVKAKYRNFGKASSRDHNSLGLLMAQRIMTAKKVIAPVLLLPAFVLQRKAIKHPAICKTDSIIYLCCSSEKTAQKPIQGKVFSRYDDNAITKNQKVFWHRKGKRIFEITRIDYKTGIVTAITQAGEGRHRLTFHDSQWNAMQA